MVYLQTMAPSDFFLFWKYGENHKITEKDSKSTRITGKLFIIHPYIL